MSKNLRELVPRAGAERTGGESVSTTRFCLVSSVLLFPRSSPPTHQLAPSPTQDSALTGQTASPPCGPQSSPATPTPNPAFLVRLPSSATPSPLFIAPHVGLPGPASGPLHLLSLLPGDLSLSGRYFPAYVTCLLGFCVDCPSPPLVCQLHRSCDLSRACSLLQPQSLEQSRRLVNICRTNDTEQTVAFNKISSVPGPVPAAVGDAAVTKAVQGRRQNHAQTVTTRCGPGWDWAAQGESERASWRRGHLSCKPETEESKKGRDSRQREQ